jgi:hypothetical protein
MSFASVVQRFSGIGPDSSGAQEAAAVTLAVETPPSDELHPTSETTASKMSGRFMIPPAFAQNVSSAHFLEI